MANIDSISFRRYKSFKENYATIKMNRVNVVIGRNNSGKSSCIDIIEALTDADLFRKQQSDILIGSCLSENELNNVYIKSGYTTTYYPTKQQFLGKTVKFKLGCEWRGNKPYKLNVDRIPDKDNFPEERISWDTLSDDMNTHIQLFRMRRLNAERDIVPEPYVEKDEVDVNGNGACNLINRVLNCEQYDETLVQKDLLNALNEIMCPDSKFDGITVQKISGHGNLNWEVFLYEGNERFPLSKTGSGLKTIILVLLNLIVIPKLKQKKNTINIFAFEELENNLHPALQRRLFNYIYQYSREHENTHIFLTTHSHVAINMFCDKENTQILHVVKNKGVSSIHSIDDFISKSELLNDLDVRASDLLQANGIIWVEGPSDRVYIKRWLELWGDSSLQEGRDYQFLYYGGRLLSHYTADEQEEVKLINVLTTNRNSAIVIDSDKRNEKADINDAKKRIKAEFDKKGMFCWITEGKEIENYIEYQAINLAYNSDLKTQCKQYRLFPEYIKPIKKNFSSEKVSFANKVVPYISGENAGRILDLKQKIEVLSKFIKKWNCLE